MLSFWSQEQLDSKMYWLLYCLHVNILNRCITVNLVCDKSLFFTQISINGNNYQHNMPAKNLRFFIFGIFDNPFLWMENLMWCRLEMMNRTRMSLQPTFIKTFAVAYFNRLPPLCQHLKVEHSVQVSKVGKSRLWDERSTVWSQSWQWSNPLSDWHFVQTGCRFGVKEQHTGQQCTA